MEASHTQDEIKLPASEAPAEPSDKAPSRTFNEIMAAVTSSPAFLPGVLLFAGIVLLLLPLFPRLYLLWTEDDGYYSHGFLIPLISGYVVFRWWPWLKTIPVRPSWFAIIPLAVCVYFARTASISVIEGLMSICFLATLLFSAWFIGGFRWMAALSAPILYLGFGLPLWRSLINETTNPAQIASTTVAFEMLRLLGLNPIQDSSTVVLLNTFRLDVAVPCSGLKLIVALTAFTVFFVLIAKLRFWSNVVMVSMILPLAIFINGLRIALIGIVGENYGGKAAEQFHDYSGYITLIVCFIILFKMAKVLGWKN